MKLLLVLVCCAVASVFAQSDEITNLPGLSTPINFKQYAGYITVDPQKGRNLFYWFVESQLDPATDPLVLWLNGGPGCSSVAGLLTENGPFRPNEDGKTLSINPFSWNKVANVIYLESPAGVGFSYSNDHTDYTTVGDKRTANDSYIFLQNFFTKYPQFKNSPFWIAGESYGGHYVPELANRILIGNHDGTGGVKINIQGFMAGNPWTYMPIDNAGAVFYWWSHALISDQTYAGIMKNCNFTDIGPLKTEFESADPATCNNFLSTANTEMGNINIYDIYVDVCTSSSSFNFVKQMAKAGSLFHLHMLKAINPPYYPCEDTYTTQYLNLAEVLQALHVQPGYQWQECSSVVQYNYSDVEASVLPLYQNFIKNTNLKILVYSGDVDAIVPYPGTRQWVHDLKLPILQPWRPWTLHSQVGGYVTVYQGLTLATVRQAGHMVPETQPERAFVMFSHFLAGKML